MTQRRIGEGAVFNTATGRIEEKEDREVSRGVKMTISHVAIELVQSETPTRTMPIGDIFRSARWEDLPSAQNDREVFNDFPGDSDRCCEDLNRLRDLRGSEADPDELFDITQRAIWGLQERHKYVDVLTGISREVQKEKAIESGQGYFLATERIAKEAASRWGEVRDDLKYTFNATTDKLGGEVKDAAEVIKDVTLATVNLQEHFQGAEVQLRIIKKGNDLDNKLTKLKFARAQLTEENPTNGRSEPVLTERGYQHLVKSYPGVQHADPKEQGRLVADLMHNLNSEVEDQKARVGLLAPQLDLAKIGVGTNFRAIRGNLNRLLTAIKSVEGEIPNDLTDNMQQKVESALRKIDDADKQAEARNVQPEYSEQHLEAAREATMDAKDLTKLMAGYIQDSTKDMGSGVLFALLESDRQAEQIITDQVARGKLATTRFAADVIENGDFSNKISQRLTESRAILSLVQREAVQNMTEVDNARQKVHLIAEFMNLAEESQQLLKQHSKDGDEGYEDYFKKNFWPAILKKHADETSDMDLTEDATERLVGMPILYMAGEAWRKVTATLEDKTMIFGEIAEYYRQELAVATGEYHAALEASREFLIENITLGFRDIKDVVTEIEQRRIKPATDYAADADEQPDSEDDNVDAELDLILAGGKR